jgi:hypothetical protein
MELYFTEVGGRAMCRKRCGPPAVAGAANSDEDGAGQSLTLMALANDYLRAIPGAILPPEPSR